MFKPDFYIGGKENPYMMRWYITRWSGWWRYNKDGSPRNQDTLNRLQRFVRSWPNIYLHKFLRDDEDRALHTHPWGSVSFILRGGYIEHYFDGTAYEGQPLPKIISAVRKPGRFYKRCASFAHRIELMRDTGYLYPWPQIEMPVLIRPAWTLFFTSSKSQDWGFWCTRKRHTVGGQSFDVARFVPWQQFVSATDTGNVGRGCD